jgi:hypothetical protein
MLPFKPDDAAGGSGSVRDMMFSSCSASQRVKLHDWIIEWGTARSKLRKHTRHLTTIPESI